MKRIIIQLIFLLIPLCTPAQGNLPLLPLPVLELLQYQVQKRKRAVAPYLSVSMGLGGYQQNWWLMTPVSYGVGMSVLTRILTNLNIHFTDSLQRRIIQALQSLTIGEERCKSSFGTRSIIIRWCLVFGRMATSCSKSSQRAIFFVFSVRAVL